ncbi:MAG: hypothetical protein FJX71_05400 [Alphaproteobacteria bacterium]|nr:hypothetical protein [Alphaproteobacteria bacterium]
MTIKYLTNDDLGNIWGGRSQFFGEKGLPQALNYVKDVLHTEPLGMASINHDGELVGNAGIRPIPVGIFNAADHVK